VFLESCFAIAAQFLEYRFPLKYTELCLYPERKMYAAILPSEFQHAKIIGAEGAFVRSITRELNADSGAAALSASMHEKKQK
jgi:hypothetical protein